MARLDEIIDEIIEDENRDYIPPVMFYPGLIREKEQKMGCIWFK